MKKNMSWKFTDELSVSGAGEFVLSPQLFLNSISSFLHKIVDEKVLLLHCHSVGKPQGNISSIVLKRVKSDGDKAISMFLQNIMLP